MKKVIAVGDLHGCSEPLTTLIAKFGVDANYIFLGDLIDRGSNTREVFELINKLPNKIVLRGNHEQMLLDAYVNRYNSDQGAYMWLNNGGLNVLESYGVGEDDVYSQFRGDEGVSFSNFLKKLIPQDIINLIKASKLVVKTNNYIFVHAGINPYETLENMEENTLLWIRNAFLLHPGPYVETRYVVHGHTPVAVKNMVNKYRMNLDGGYVFGNYLGIGEIDLEKTRPINLHVISKHAPDQITTYSYEDCMGSYS